jgi:serine phosphatase RsbU (regulator of sigma subunit)
MVTERPLDLIDLLNKALMTAPDAASRSQFTTLLLGTFAEHPSGGLEITIAGGGHPHPLVIRAAGATRAAPDASPDTAGGAAPQTSSDSADTTMVEAAVETAVEAAVETVRVGGMPIGALGQARFNEVSLRLGPDDLLLVYSDGVTEARGGPTGTEMLGEARLRHALAGCAGSTPDEVVRRLMQLVENWLAVPGLAARKLATVHDHDDIALLAIAYSG